jgi:hypothetical protein
MRPSGSYTEESKPEATAMRSGLNFLSAGLITVSNAYK